MNVMTTMDEPGELPPPALPGEPRRSGARAYYTVVVLTLVYAFAFIDRQIFNLLVTPIKKDFNVTDLDVGYLLGPAFILSYISLGLPAGWCVDRFNRKRLMLAAGLVWSLGTMAGALAHSYSGLFWSRLIVGASEALVYPAGMSFIADLFDRRRLPFATSLFILAPSLGGGLALIGGGFVLSATERYATIMLPIFGPIHGWQGTLLIVGLVGLIPVLLLTTIKDAPRPAPHQAAAIEHYGLIKGTGYMVQRWRFFMAFFFGLACSSMVMLTVSAWAPTYLQRTFHLTAAEIGTHYGPLVLVFGIAGGIASPAINAWWARRRPLDSMMRVVVLGPCMLVPIALCLLLARSETLALVCLALLTFCYNFPLSMGSAAMQVATPPRLRGVASAWYFVIVSLIGYGVGPTLVPIVADSMLHDPNKVGVAMAMVAALFGLIAIGLTWVALGGFRQERERLAASLSL